MTTRHIIISFLTALLVSNVVRAQMYPPAALSPAATNTSGDSNGEDLPSRSSRYAELQSRYTYRPLIRSGAVMLAVGWGVSALLGAVIADLDKPMAIRMSIPLVGTLAPALELLTDTPALGVLLLAPTLIQWIGGGLLISGIVKRQDHQERFGPVKVSATPLLFEQGGAGSNLAVTY